MNLKLETQKREMGKKSNLTTLRKSGFIPAVVYGEDLADNINISICDSDFMKSIKKSLGELAFYDLNIEGKEYRTVIKEKQIHPVSRKTLHIDFQVLHEGSPIVVHIPFKFTGIPAGAKHGGLLEILHRNVEVVCLPKHIVEDIEVDVSSLENGQSFHISQINLHKLNLKLKHESDLVLAVVHPPKGVEAVATETPAPEK